MLEDIETQLKRLSLEELANMSIIWAKDPYEMILVPPTDETIVVVFSSEEADSVNEYFAKVFGDVTCEEAQQKVSIYRMLEQVKSLDLHPSEIEEELNGGRD